jgi:hypothetical protein
MKAKAKVHYGVDVGLYYKDDKNDVGDEISYIMNKYKRLYKAKYSASGCGFGYYDWQVEFDSKKKAKRVYDEIVKLFRQRKIKFGKSAKSYVNLYTFKEADL